LAAILLTGLSSPFVTSAQADTVPQAGGTTLTVTVMGVKKLKGTILASLCDAAEYAKDDCLRSADAKVTGSTVTVTFKEVPAGRWAIQLQQDLNGNGGMDFNFLGIPKEPFGLSNVRKFPLGRPKFDAVSLLVGSVDVYVNVKLLNP
jgi:uncharacterized protein (DUF2141 family)